MSTISNWTVFIGCAWTSGWSCGWHAAGLQRLFPTSQSSKVAACRSTQRAQDAVWRIEVNLRLHTCGPASSTFKFRRNHTSWLLRRKSPTVEWQWQHGLFSCNITKCLCSYIQGLHRSKHTTHIARTINPQDQRNTLVKGCGCRCLEGDSTLGLDVYTASSANSIQRPNATVSFGLYIVADIRPALK